MPTLTKILDQGASAILMSHLGRPKNSVMYPAEEMKKEDEFSLKPVATRLEEILKAEDASKAKPVLFAEDCMKADGVIASLEPGQVCLLENVRFYKNEGSKKEDERMEMAKKLASYGDFFVSDAFGTAHRNSASMTGIPKVLGAGVAGILMEKEISAFASVLSDPPRPLVAIVGGSKVSDKILLLENMIQKIDKLLIGGAMAYTFLKAQGKEIGKSFSQAGQTFTGKDGKEMEITDLAKELLEKAAAKGVEVCLPLDHICHTKFGKPEGDEKEVITDDENIPADVMALDIGPKTVELYKSKIRECKAAIWNGPVSTKFGAVVAGMPILCLFFEIFL